MPGFFLLSLVAKVGRTRIRPQRVFTPDLTPDCIIEIGEPMRIDCYISLGCGSEEALKESIARALEAEKITYDIFRTIRVMVSSNLVM